MDSTRYALVTGASRGIGRAVALALARCGYRLLLNYRSQTDAAQAVLDQIVSEGGQAELLPFDVSDGKAVDTALLGWEEQHPEARISVLVNNAGIRQDALMVLMNDAQWQDILGVHLNGFFYVTRRVLKGMLTSRYGRIVNIVSLSGLKGMPGQANYAAAKAGIIGATKSLAQEVGPRKVTVNAVAPGFIHTEMTADISELDHKKQIPLQRFGTPEEVADLVVFLASDKAAYITGEVISINGGLYT